MVKYGSPICERENVEGLAFHDEVVAGGQPAVLRQIAKDWPAVQAAQAPGGVAAYITSLDTHIACNLLEGPPEISGRFFYNDELDGFNFTRRPTTVSALISRLIELEFAAEAPALAVQAVRTSEVLPGFAEANQMPLVDPALAPRLWIGNRVCVATHHDLYRNLAVCVAGRRRFTLFPPDQVYNLYIGPLEFAPAGAPVSMVEGTRPDLVRFPRFAEAMASAQVTELSPGDAIYIPYMWWHQVESLDPFSVLANYWWNDTVADQPSPNPVDALMHTRLALLNGSPEQRAAWREMFNYVVFNAETPEYLPRAKRGIRGLFGRAARLKLQRQLAARLSV